MCGIVGYVGTENCATVLLDALADLEYRGYDSAGIAIANKTGIHTVKTTGRLANLQQELNRIGTPAGTVGIGHTRWATHGAPCDRNAHPHTVGRVTVVHNGIIENFQPLKTALQAEGVTFYSDTDTEVVAALLDQVYQEDPVDALRQVTAQLIGSYALGVLFQDRPDTLYAVRQDSPLILAHSSSARFIASDITALLTHTRRYILPDNGEIAVLTAEETVVFNAAGKRVTKPERVADWERHTAQKGDYPHFMLKEIYEQPEAIRNTITPYTDEGLPALAACGIPATLWNTVNHIHIVACGTAMHAGMVGKHLIETLARLPVTVEIASEFRYRHPLISPVDLVIVISQSGETADTLAALRAAKASGAKTLGIVNVKGSSIAREADMLLYTHAGPEIAVASTKAYTVQLAMVYMVALESGWRRGQLSKDTCRRLTGLLQECPSQVERALACDPLCAKAATALQTANNLLYIGRGLDHALSMEGALKLKEISYIHAESYAAGELKHGTISLITEGTPVIAVVTQRDLAEKTASNIKEAKARGAQVIAVCTNDLLSGTDMVDTRISLPLTEDIFAPLTAVVPLQLLAYHTAVQRGNDVDKPRNLAKSVTVE